MFIKDKNLLVSGIDHGFCLMKTPHSVFENGVEQLSGEAVLTTNTLKWKGEYFKVGEGRLPMMEVKTSDDNYFRLTLAAIAKELNVYQQKKCNVILAVGLPFSRFAREKEDFRNYLLREGEISFSYCGKEYCIAIQDVYVFPQCYAAIVSHIREYGRENLVVDIGSKTIDIIHTKNYVPVERDSTSVAEAMIQCMTNIKNDVYQNCNRRIREDVIWQMTMGENPVLPEECKQYVIKGLRDFARNVEAKLSEIGFDLEMMPVVYLGGGATVMKQYGTRQGENVHYIEDVCANAKGYEYLARQKLKC